MSESAENDGSDGRSSLPYCHHWLPKKRHFCPFPVVTPGSLYCNHHLPVTRVPCPVDPSHSIYASQLRKHVRHCPALRFAPEGKPYYSRNTNVLYNDDDDGDDNEESAYVRVRHPEVSLGRLGALVEGGGSRPFEALLAWVEETYERLSSAEPIQQQCYRPPWSEPLFHAGEVRRHKHLSQQVSLVAHLESHGLLLQHQQPRCSSCLLTFAELGAGKGGLSLLLAQRAPGCACVLVDRQSYKRSARHDQAEGCRAFIRLRVDLKDLQLSGLVAEVMKEQQQEENRDEKEEESGEAGGVPEVVLVGKHLCGAATDLAIQCLANSVSSSSPPTNVAGLCVALCCHHLCSWRAYVGRAFLAELGLVTQADFELLCALTSWGCSSGGEGHGRPPISPSSSQRSTWEEVRRGLTPEQRQLLGWKAKRVLDYGRLSYIRSLLEQEGGQAYGGKLAQYVDSSCTPENVLLLAWKEHRE